MSSEPQKDLYHTLEIIDNSNCVYIYVQSDITNAKQFKLCVCVYIYAIRYNKREITDMAMNQIAELKSYRNL